MAEPTHGAVGAEREELLSLRDQWEAELASRLRVPPKSVSPTDSFPEAGGNEGINLYLIDEKTRQEVRAWVESQPVMAQFIIEAAPATIGTFLGILGGAGWGSLPLAMAGGLTGEGIGQELGLTPRSDVGLALSVAGPVVGRLGGGVLKAGRKGAAIAGKTFLPARVALAKKAMVEAAEYMEAGATRIFAQQTGMMKQSVSRLYKIAEDSGVMIPKFNLTATNKSFGPLREELLKMKGLPDVRAAIRLLDDMQKTLGQHAVSFGELVAARKIVGIAIKKAKRATGVTIGAEKQFFKAIAEDIERLARGGTKLSYSKKTQAIAQVALAASKRAKLGFAVDDLTEGFRQFLKELPGSNTVELNIKGMRKWLLDATSVGNKKYNKQMSEALEEVMPTIKESLRVFSVYHETNAAGKSSLIIRGIFAGMGAKLMAPFGTLAMGMGAVAGSRIPDGLVVILSSQPAMAMLRKTIALGQRDISKKLWDTLGQIAMQGIKVNEPRKRPSPQRGPLMPGQPSPTRPAPPLGGPR
jgi:hypothetical protein